MHQNLLSFSGPCHLSISWCHPKSCSHFSTQDSPLVISKHSNPLNTSMIVGMQLSIRAPGTRGDQEHALVQGTGASWIGARAKCSACAKNLAATLGRNRWAVNAMIGEGMACRCEEQACILSRADPHEANRLQLFGHINAATVGQKPASHLPAS